MSQSGARELLATLDPCDYVEAQRRAGRSGLDPSFVEHWASQHREADALLKRGRLGPELSEALLLFREITYPMAMHERSAIPSYYPYTCVNVLDWFMRSDGGDLEELKRKCVLGMTALLLDIGRFELHSLIGYEPFQTLRFEPERALTRIQHLREMYAAATALGERIAGASTRLPWAPFAAAKVTEYATGPGRVGALVHFSLLPQTGFHDEVLFLRSIHVSELCFYGIRISVTQAKDAMGRGDYAGARGFLEQAVGFSGVLRQAFLLLRTMPPEHFHDFRAAAANASAVQSINYQLMEIALFGLSEHKVALYRRIPHLAGLLREENRDSPCLRSVILDRSASAEDEGVAPMIEQARQLDRKLLGWRGLHVAFALEYLSDTPVGTGGTAGAPYLKQFLWDTLFEETRGEVDTGQGPSEAEGAESGHPGLHIAPARELIGPDRIIVTTESAEQL
jgi:tryptophan 2,3-dioxygenase